MARLFFIAAQEIKQIISNLGAEPRNSGSLGAARLFFIAAQEIKQIILNLGARPRNSGSLGRLRAGAECVKVRGESLF